MPLVRNPAGDFVGTGWDDAFARCAELIGGVRAEHGTDAITAYVGNPAAHNYSISRYVGLTDAAAIDDGYFSNLATLSGADPEKALAAAPEPGPDRLYDLSIRTGPWGDRYGENPDGLTLEKLKEHPDGIDFGPMVPRIDEVVLHPDGKVDLAPDHIAADIGRLTARLDRPVEPLVLTSRRHLRSNNSWMHNVKVLVSGKDRCTLLIHPDDAAARGVTDGAVAVVSSSNGTVEVPAEVSDEMMPGVVSLPHGWGHDKPGTRLSVAREHAGVNNNLLAPPEFVDAPSGNARRERHPRRSRPSLRGSVGVPEFGRESTVDEVLDGIDLSGKVFVVTGSSSGLGEESARGLAARGAHVAMAAPRRRKQRGGRATDRCSCPGRRPVIAPAGPR